MIYLKAAIVIVGVAWLLFVLLPLKDQPELSLPSLGLTPVKTGDWIGVGRVTIWQRESDGTCWWESVNGLWERDRSWCE